MDEKRKNLRVVPSLDAPVEVEIIGRDFVGAIFAHDICEKGIAIIVPTLFEGCNIDASVEIIIALPEVGLFKARGLIRHIHMDPPVPGILGVQFTAIEEDDHTLLKRYIEKQLDL